MMGYAGIGIGPIDIEGSDGGYDTGNTGGGTGRVRGM